MDDIDKNCGNCRFYPECDFPECLVCPDWKEEDKSCVFLRRLYE